MSWLIAGSRFSPVLSRSNPFAAMMDGCPCFADPAPHLDYANEFLVKWRDAQTGHTQFLGQLASAGRRCGALSMWFADDAEQKCMIGFSLPLRMRAGTKKRRDVHVVLPAKSFSSTDTSSFFSLDVVTAQDDPEAKHEFQKAGLDSSAKLLRLSFDLRERAYAIMPTEPFTHPLPSNSRGLLLGLRSLTCTLTFDVYLPFLESAKELLGHFSTKPRRLPVESPLIDHVKTYSGRSWGVDQWAVYGIEDDDAMPSAWNPVIDDDPPPYEEAVCEKPVLQPDQLPHGQTSDELHQHLKLLVEQEHARRHAGNGDAASIPDTASWSGSEHGNNAPILPSKRKADQLSLESENPHKCRPPASNDQAIKPLKLERNVFHTTEDEVFISARSLLNGGPNAKLFTEAQHRCFTIALNWFVTVWRERADAHVAFLPELKGLARLARGAESGQPETMETFEDYRVECMQEFCRNDRPRRKTSFRHDLSVEDKLRLVHQFIYRPDAALQPGRDCCILDDLFALHEAAKACNEAPKGKREELEFAFDVQMAACVLLVLYGTVHD
ncbi:hypothetical protein HDK77DRAFT_322459 [Phyllosticta capitalensis]|uniref:Uncharacterized protein n=1 Tax=Phyllosticta capitalensis TaxID=121624 RepID=A0ABR1YJK1_9PEZI